jgi:hypothetical protein
MYAMPVVDASVISIKLLSNRAVLVPISLPVLKFQTLVGTAVSIEILHLFSVVRAMAPKSEQFRLRTSGNNLPIPKLN